MADVLTSHPRDQILQGYQKKREVAVALCQTLEPLLSRVVPPRLVVALSHRIKDFDSFFRKANNLKDDGSLKYLDPLNDIKDLIGFRIIVVARRNVEDVCRSLRSTLHIVEEENKADALLEKGILGYESHHLIAQLGRQRQKLEEYSGLCDANFEIQVRTALQHAWAENEHRVQYRATKKDPELNKRFLRLAGIISSADEEFDRIYEINERLRIGVEEAVSKLPSEKSPIVSERPVEDEVDELVSGHDRELHQIATMFGMPAIELVRRQRFLEAIQVYDRFIALQPKQPTHYAGRARAKALAGDIDGALDDLQTADELAPGHPAVRNVARLLDKLIPRDEDEEGPATAA